MLQVHACALQACGVAAGRPQGLAFGDSVTAHIRHPLLLVHFMSIVAALS